VALLFKAGAQVPDIPFVEVAGKGDSTSPAQIGATGLNKGAIPGSTVTVRLVTDAH